MVGAIDLAKEIGPGKRVVSFACDSGLKYLGTHVYLKKIDRFSNLKHTKALTLKQ